MVFIAISFITPTRVYTQQQQPTMKYATNPYKWNLFSKSRVKGEPVDIDPECVSHDEYLSEFKSMLITKLRNAIDTDISNDPDCIKGRRKTVQVS